MIIKCPECGHQVSDQAKTCPSCGVDIAGNIITCSECGEVVLSNQTMCPNCHAMLNQQPVRPIYNHVKKEETSADEDNQKPPKKKGKTLVWVLVVALVIALSLVFAGLYMYQNMLKHNEEEAYINAIMSDEPSVLQNYIDLFGEQAPQEHLDSVQAHIDKFRMLEKDWNDAKVACNKNILERYIKTYPNSVHEKEALLMIDSIDWAVATKADTQESYAKYMDNHRDGQHFYDAQQKYDKKIEEQRLAADTLQIP